MLHDAMNKSGYFKFLDISYDNLHGLIPIYKTPVTLVVRNDAAIDSLKNLKGKRLNAGSPRSVQHLAVDTILKAKNWTENDFSLMGELPTSLSQVTMAFCNGTIQAMVHIGVHPDSSLQQLFKLCKAELTAMFDGDIEKFVNEHPAYSKIIIPASTYPSYPKEVTTFGTTAILVASKDLDEETVYKIVEIIDGNRKRLKNAHSTLSPLSVEAEQKDILGIKIHPGAIKYFSTH
jgi:TRAP transporter TAXI family solute receptor